MNNRTHARKLSAAQQMCDLRNQASDLLNQLLDHREQSEARFAEVGQTDPIKSITGRSAIDNAIETTRHLIRELETHLQDAPQPATVVETSHANGQRIKTAP